MSCLIIAEMANAHEGDPEMARAIVEAVANAGADAIKFQVFTAAELAVPTYAHFNLYETLQMSEKVWEDLINRAKSLGLRVYSDVFGGDSALLMQRLQVDGLMIHAADISNRPLLRQVGGVGKDIILSMAGSNFSEVAGALAVLKEAGASSILLMHGFQRYPTALSDSYLNRLQLIKKEFKLPIGFASHLDGGSSEAPILPALAVAAGADAVEVHVTLDRSKQGLDYYSSLDPSVFAKMVGLVRKVESALGPCSTEITESELKYRMGHRKCLVAMRDIPQGVIIREEDIALKRINNPPDNPSPDLDVVVGRSAKVMIQQFSPVNLRDLQ